MSDNYLHDSWWQDKPEYLPDGTIMRVEDIRNMMSGKPFSIFRPGKPRQDLSPADNNLFLRYLEAHNMTQMFGLPNGQGWANETPMTLKVLSYFQKLTNIIENWLMKKGNK